MYAVIKSGGKQHRVTTDERLKVELIDAKQGDTLTINDVLMTVDGNNIQIGQPVLEGASVTAEVIEHGRSDKVRIIKHKRRKHHHKEQGHRQWYTLLKITAINV